MNYKKRIKHSQHDALFTVPLKLKQFTDPARGIAVANCQIKRIVELHSIPAANEWVANQLSQFQQANVQVKLK